jgi:hypothetical protein
MPLNDDALASRIEEVFRDRGLTNDCDLEMSVEDAVVALNGTVPTRGRREEVLEAVRSVAGVDSIECDLFVSQEGIDLPFEVLTVEDSQESSSELFEKELGWVEDNETDS